MTREELVRRWVDWADDQKLSPETLAVILNQTPHEIFMAGPVQLRWNGYGWVY